MRSLRIAALAAAATTVATAGAAAAVTTPSQAGRPVTAHHAVAPLVADAGDSGYADVGDPVTFLGAGFGGVAPYRFRWTVDAGELHGADAATAQVLTTKVKPGVHVARLTVRDRRGATATDTVRFYLAGRVQKVLLDKTVADTTPGVTGMNSSMEFPFAVPAGTASFTVNADWQVPASDYDLRVLNPKGGEACSSGNGATSAPDFYEHCSVDKPVAGTWKAVLDRFATPGDPAVHVNVAGVLAPGRDPRPVVNAGGNRRFVIGRAQPLSAKVTGGKAPVRTAWDLNGDGRYERAGARIADAHLAPGLHLVTVKATSANGFERRQSVTVFVGTAEQVKHWDVPITVVGIADTGINPYHLEYSAQTYPDPRVLEVTRNFTRPPSEYIPGYPKDAEPLPVTLGKGYYPKQDRYLWDGNKVIKPGKLYWIPGTKIIGAYDAGGSTGVTSSDDPHPILDDNEHGTGTSSVSTGNRYGYCPTCLLVMVEGLDEDVNAQFPWVDISSNSFGPVAGAPTGLLGTDDTVKHAAERGQIDLFAAGNGVGNAFDVPVSTTVQTETGPDWNIAVGAIRRDNQGAIIGDGNPVDISAWGDGNLPSACGVGDVGQCAFGGTSAATPYTAGVFGNVLTRVREVLGDTGVGQRPHQVIAQGTPVLRSPYLRDGKLTRRELIAAVLKTAAPLTTDGVTSTAYPYPATYTGSAGRYLFEGYGAATPNSASRALAVLLGTMPMPDRSDADQFFQADCQSRDAIYGSYDRNGDGKPDDCSADWSAAPEFQGKGKLTTDPAGSATFSAGRRAIAPRAVSRAPFTYYLHRSFVGTPEHAGGEPAGETDAPLGTQPGCGNTSQYDQEYMTRVNSKGDKEPCYDSRATSVAAAFRPIGIFASSDTLTTALPKGSKVDVTVFVASSTPLVEVRGLLEAGDRILGQGGTGTPVPIAPSDPTGQSCSGGGPCWNKIAFSFTTDRPAVAGEQLTMEFQHTGSQAWAYGYEGDHVSKVTVTPAGSAKGLGFGATVDKVVAKPGYSVVSGRVAFPDLGPDPEHAGFHPATRLVEVSVGDPTFSQPVYVRPAGNGTYAAVAPLGSGAVYARAVLDGRASAASGWRPAASARSASSHSASSSATSSRSRGAAVAPAALSPELSSELTAARPAQGHKWPAAAIANLLLVGVAAAHRSVRRAALR